MSKKRRTSPSKKAVSKPSSNVPQSKLKRFSLFCLKASLVFILALGLYVIYLDSKVRKTFEGQRWHVPVQVYGEIETFAQGNFLNLSELRTNLTLLGYQKVKTVFEPGQFAMSESRIIIYRRSFDFGSGLEQPVRITIDVEDNQVSQVYLEDSPAFVVRLEPKLIARIVPDNKEDRVIAPLQTVPERLIDTLLLVEDRDFYFHKGVAPLAIVRALFANLAAGRTVQGGSTLTQQLVKNMYLTREKTLTRKANEALMALILEYRYSKDQLLEAYINEVYLGQHYANGIYGFGLAAKFYFGKTIDQLSPAQMATLIGQIKGPSYYDPWRYPERATKRRDLILRMMAENNLINHVEYQHAVESPLSVRKTRRLSQQDYPAYIQQVKRELADILSPQLQQSGIRIFTGFSPSIQKNAEQAVAKRLSLFAKDGEQALQSAMIVTDSYSGQVRAIVGGKETQYAGFNRALNAARPIGSLIKPIVYAGALEQYESYQLGSILNDEAITLTSDAGKTWQPKNYDGEFRGRVSLLDALVYSLNVPTVNLGMEISLDRVANLLHILGYDEDVRHNPSMLLGAIDMTPWQVNQIYLPLSDHGRYQRAHTIEKVLSAQGETLYQYDHPKEQRLSLQASYLIDYSLQQVTERGSARSLKWRLPEQTLAGKTGTTNEQRDSWFVGYDNRHLVTTWVGRDDNKATSHTGSSGALVVFAEFMKQQGVVPLQRTAPDGVAMMRFENTTGNAVTDYCADTRQYPAIVAGIVVSEQCQQPRGKINTWLGRLFGDDE
ncbi:penicillin-binding protein 1B [Thalassotalea agarivorans]|uniref:Penicillin-binding protein 1B n=1 Tax=Thalassotalea agarivorans TaxID=349064 RepID=A0A1I0GN47_THASX|nr:penicillin-binding protein 1B [Thalassotalea agarivorans]SET72345.1 penicillin-binding protein 1B [Thalassotalea agarivorans]